MVQPKYALGITEDKGKGYGSQSGGSRKLRQTESDKNKKREERGLCF